VLSSASPYIEILLVLLNLTTLYQLQMIHSMKREENMNVELGRKRW